MPMKKKENHDFEYYEEKAAYFQYTHNSDYEDDDISEAYLNLDHGVIEAVQARAEKDASNGAKIGQKELENYIVQHELVKPEDALSVIGELYDDYELAYMGVEALLQSENRKKPG
jgi:hypothetical protein